MAKEKTTKAQTTETVEEEINIDTAELNKEEPVIVTEFPYDNLVMSIADYLKQVGNMIWINDNTPEEDGEISKTISIVRSLSDGTKQKIAITVEQKNELKIK